MFIRRLATSACALGLIIPAAAGAQQADHIFPQPVPEKTHTVYGDTKYDLQNKQDLAPKGDTKNDVTPSYADRVGSLTAAQLAAAYGTTMPKATPIASPAASSTDDGTDGWRIAAVVEAGLLAAIALAGAAFVARRRPQRSVTA
jgi:MYXO-CTERM domain-containing protein